jgi:hypothetical protein
VGADHENVTEYLRWEVGHPESERAQTCEINLVTIEEKKDRKVMKIDSHLWSG